MERKEAIEIVRKNFPDNGFTMLREALETLIPELVESEDEKIKKEIISYIKSSSAVTNQDWIAWLEKQGEQKPSWSEEDEIGYNDALFAIEKARLVAKDENDMGNLWFAEKWLKSLKSRVVKIEKQGEQKHTNSADDERLRKTTISFLKDFADKGYENAVECIDWLEKQDGQKSVDWNQSDSSKSDFIKNK